MATRVESLTFTVVDSAGRSFVLGPVQITVTDALSATVSPGDASVIAGESVVETLSATGGTPPYTITGSATAGTLTQDPTNPFRWTYTASAT